MPRFKYIFFDVGNTLLFPNRAKILAPLSKDKHPDLGAWQAVERRTKHEFDQGLMSGKVDHGFWWTFHSHLLREISALLKQRVRDSDTVARVGGDEFAMLLAGCPLDKARQIADDITPANSRRPSCSSSRPRASPFPVLIRAPA